MSTRFALRAQMEEIMDDLDCSGEVVRQTLKELGLINKWLGGNAVSLDGITRLLAKWGKPDKPLALADLGCGGGEMLIEIARWGKKNNIAMSLTGIDANPHIVAMAQAQARAAGYPQIRFVQQNVSSKEFQNTRFDIITASLFTHHFSSSELAGLFRSLCRQARIGMVINDLHRHWLAYYSIKWLTTLFSRSAMVRFDAPVSVLRAFSRSDWTDILGQAGIARYTLTWKWAFRWQLIISTGQKGTV